MFSAYVAQELHDDVRYAKWEPLSESICEGAPNLPKRLIKQLVAFCASALSHTYNSTHLVKYLLLLRWNRGFFWGLRESLRNIEKPRGNRKRSASGRAVSRCFEKIREDQPKNTGYFFHSKVTTWQDAGLKVQLVQSSTVAVLSCLLDRRHFFSWDICLW